MAMDENEVENQQELHDAIEDALRAQGDLPEGHILAGWVICFETASMRDDDALAGHLYGPREMTTWRAMGLIEWVRRFNLNPAKEDDNDEDE